MLDGTILANAAAVETLELGSISAPIIEPSEPHKLEPNHKIQKKEVPKNITFEFDFEAKTWQPPKRVGEQLADHKMDDIQEMETTEKPISAPQNVTPELKTVTFPPQKPVRKSAVKSPKRRMKRNDRRQNERKVRLTINKFVKRGKKITTVAIAAETDISRRTVTNIRKELKI